MGGGVIISLNRWFFGSQNKKSKTKSNYNG